MRLICKECGRSRMIARPRKGKMTCKCGAIMVEHQPMVLSASKCCSKCRHLMPAYIGDALQGHCALDNHEIGVPDGEVCDRFAAYVPTSGGVEIEPETD